MSADRHGGPRDRGSADAYYGRGRRPHYFKGATYMSEEVVEANMTDAEIAEYDEGFDQQVERKDWGHD